MSTRSLGLGTAVLALLLATSALAGCSSDSSDAIPKAEYVKQAKAICEETRKNIEREQGELDENDPAVLTDYVKFVSAEMLQEVADLKTIGLPEDGGEELSNAYEIYEQRFTKWQANPADAATGSTDKLFKSAGKTFKEHGVEACAADV